MTSNGEKRATFEVSLEPGEIATLERVEDEYVARVVEALGGNKTLAAKVLGIARKTLYRRLGMLKEGQ